MNPWDLLLWAFVIGLSALIAAPGLAIAVGLITVAAGGHRYTRITSTKEDIL